MFMQDIPTALLPLILKYESAPQGAERVVPGQSDLLAHWSEINNDLLKLDQQLGQTVCQSFYNELQAYRSGDVFPFIERKRIVAALIAAAPEVARKSYSQGTYADHYKLQKLISELERNGQ
jgi:hypothetical protein